MTPNKDTYEDEICFITDKRSHHFKLYKNGLKRYEYKIGT